ncbi:hypothetical protein IRY55_02485 [Savagea sp. SN6]|uniref:Uncharacterized protein n=1 Tax=Savagea serpentis TaxID=2785297 RepID=A0A8J7KGU6_9BACL|nr:hypothetical protein [Savagea serpentis]MBF4500218.1 hypothetical protein [Savagea serpentis]
MIYNINDFIEKELEESTDSFLFEESEQHQILLGSNFIRVPELEVDIYQGSYLIFNEEEGEFYDDFSIFVFMETGTKKAVYDEGYTGLTGAITNYCHAKSKKVNFDNLKVIYNIA